MFGLVVASTGPFSRLEEGFAEDDYDKNDVADKGCLKMSTVHYTVEETPTFISIANHGLRRGRCAGT